MSIQKILSPLLIISYVCGSRMVEFPRDVRRQWFGFLYMLLLWSLYNFTLIYVVIPCTMYYSTLYHIWVGINIFVAFLSIIIGIYHEKAFKNCIKNLNAVDDTLEKLEITTDYKLYMRTIWCLLGWFMTAVLIVCLEIASSNNNFLKINIMQDIYVSLIRIYCININIISDLTITSMLWYIGLKFDQINGYLDKLTNKGRINGISEESISFFHQSRYTEAPRNAYMIWIVIHLHSELRKISRKIDLIFGTQMTMEMGCYFAQIALVIQEIFDVIFIKDYNNKMYYVILLIVWLLLNIFRLFLINYECEKVSFKANATGTFISKLSYSNCDVEIRENILQFLLMTQSPFRFCGLRFFQFGFKFLQTFTTSVATVLVILLQAYTNKYVHLKQKYNNCNM